MTGFAVRWMSAAVVVMMALTVAAPAMAVGFAGVARSLNAFDLFEAVDLRNRLDPAAPEAWDALLGRWGETVPVIIELEGEPLLASGPTPELRKALDAAQAPIREEIAALGGTVTASYAYTFNGLAASVPRYRLAQVAAMAGVRGVFVDDIVTISTETSVPFIGAPALWAMEVGGMNVRGQGMRIAVIDTGIDYTHAAFGGAGTPDAFSTNDPNVIEAGSFPTAKVVFGWDFVGTNFNSRDPANNTPMPDPDPLDENGHGTHVASTAAGFAVPGTVAEGVAPEAVLYAIKVFGRGGSTFSSIVAAAIELAVDPNRDGDLSDRADVINMSLGGAFGDENNIGAVASNRAVAAGTIVVASAGNEGNVPYITGAPAVASDSISVAASQDDGIVFNAVRIEAPAGLAGMVEAREGGITRSLAATGDITDNLVYVGRGCTADAYLGNPTGAIALIDRGVCTFAEKILRAQGAGAIAVVVANNVAGDPIVMGGSSAGITIPGVMITRDAGTRIKNALSAGDTVTVTLSAAFQFPKPDFADTLAGFTSRGPSTSGSRLKPDLAAPGVDIRAAAMGSGTGGRLSSGTSMAAPHTAGAAALLRQLHPDWSVAEIKALLMNTATATHVRGTTTANPAVLEGAGRIDLAAAGRTTTVALPASVSFGVIAVMGADQELTAAIEVRNKGDLAKEFSVSSAIASRPGVTLSVEPSTLSVGPGASATLTASLRLVAAEITRPSRLPEIEGSIRLTQVGADPAESLRLRVHAIPFPASVAGADPSVVLSSSTKMGTLRVRNPGTFPADVHLYALGAQDPNEAAVPDLYDIRAVGARMLVSPTLGPIVEFGVATYAPWSSPNAVEFDVYIDVNGDNAADFVAFTVDFDFLTTGAFSRELYVSVVLNLATGAMVRALLISTGGSYNQAVMGIPVAAADLGLTLTGNTSFQYAVLGFGQFAPFDVVGPRGAKLFPALAFDIASPPVLFATTVLTNLVGEASVDLMANEAFGAVSKQGVLLLEPRDAPGAQSSIALLTLGRGR